MNPVLFVDAGSGVHSLNSSQCHVGCVCKINTISLSYPADSALFPSAPEEAATGTVVESVVKRLRLPSEVKGGGVGGALIPAKLHFCDVQGRRTGSPFHLPQTLPHNSAVFRV